jgi:glycosyltransferase involved in cell wall biosynthesis
MGIETTAPQREVHAQEETASHARKTIVVMPAYNAARTLEQTYSRIPANSYDEIILVDDASSDNTWSVATSLPIVALRHRKNRGYGGNQKTCYTRALEQGADCIVMLHPDNQYDPSIVPELSRPIQTGEADVVLASRMMGDPLAGGMPLWKYIANRFLTGLENIALGTQLENEVHL